MNVTQPSRLKPCPECKAGKHGNCDGVTWNDATDSPAVCPCDHSSPSDQALAQLRERLTNPTAESARRARYHSALASARLDAVLAIADEEQAELRAELEHLRGLAVGLRDVWLSTSPSGLMSRRRAAETLTDVFSLPTPTPSRSNP